MLVSTYLLDDPIAWGRKLIELHDLDPVYDILAKGREDKIISPARLKRWLLTYWCLYHTGVASYISNKRGSEFWALLMVAARNKDGNWPRSTERRHWRGQAAIDCVKHLRARYANPEDAVDEVVSDPIYDRAADVLGDWVQFGPWITFKALDMCERVLGVPIAFPEGVIFYDSPREGAEEAGIVLGLQGSSRAAFSRSRPSIPPEPLDGATGKPRGLLEGVLEGQGRPGKAGKAGREPSPRRGKGAAGNLSLQARAAIDRMMEAYSDLPAPGLPNRNCGLMEVETVCCKFKSTRSGHYFLGKDLHEIGEALKGWGKLATKLSMYLPKGPKL